MKYYLYLSFRNSVDVSEIDLEKYGISAEDLDLLPRCSFCDYRVFSTEGEELYVTHRCVSKMRIKAELEPDRNWESGSNFAGQVLEQLIHNLKIEKEYGNV